jgi:hypothetical protein
MRFPPERAEHPNHLHPPRAPIRTVIREAIAKKWTSLWKMNQEDLTFADSHQNRRGRQLILHRAIHRSISSIITQIRTRKIGFGDFLHVREVPGSVDPQCLCRQGKQTMSPILRSCRKFREERKRERMWATEQVDESGDHDRSRRVIGLRALLTVPKHTVKARQIYAGNGGFSRNLGATSQCDGSSESYH